MVKLPFSILRSNGNSLQVIQTRQCNICSVIGQHLRAIRGVGSWWWGKSTNLHGWGYFCPGQWGSLLNFGGNSDRSLQVVIIHGGHCSCGSQRAICRKEYKGSKKINTVDRSYQISFVTDHFKARTQTKQIFDGTGNGIILNVACTTTKTTTNRGKTTNGGQGGRGKLVQMGSSLQSWLLLHF